MWELSEEVIFSYKVNSWNEFIIANWPPVEFLLRLDEFSLYETYKSIYLLSYIKHS